MHGTFNHNAISVQDQAQAQAAILKHLATEITGLEAQLSSAQGSIEEAVQHGAAVAAAEKVRGQGKIATTIPTEAH
jgi:hypothetical protein